MSEQQARKIMAVIHGRYAYRPERDPPPYELLGNSADGTNSCLAMLQFGIELLVRWAVGRSDQYASEVNQRRHGLSGWTLERYTETPDGSTDPSAVDMIFRFRFGDPRDPHRLAIALRVLVTRFNQGLTFDVGFAGPAAVRFLRVQARIVPASAGVVRITPDPSPSPTRAPAARPRSAGAPHAPPRHSASH